MKTIITHVTVFVLGVITMGLIIAVINSYKEPKIKEKEEIIEIPVKLEQPEFMLYDSPTDSLVLVACKYYGIKHDSIVLAQAKLETGNYKSYQCRVNNNLFGLFNSRTMDYYKFEHWWESVEGYRDLIQYRYKDGDYYTWIKKIGYAEDPEYVSKLKYIKKRFIDNHT